MRIATWNVNSINARLDTVLTWFREASPDVACLQEIKCVDEKFPAEAFESLGYNVAVHGQKTYNGVAMLSKSPMEDIRRGLPDGEGDDHARYIEALISGPRPVRVGGLYLPNGNPIGTEKFTYKLAWMARLNAHARGLLALEERLVLAGDYNVIPEPADCEDPAAWLGDGLAATEADMRRQGEALLRLGFRAVLMKGGPLDGDAAVDWLILPGAAHRFAAPRLPSPNLHGTGCTLSSAVAAHVARGFDLVEAVRRAKAFVRDAIVRGRGAKLGQGAGPLLQLDLAPD